MEAQLLRTFVAVARLGSFSAAAAELGYTQAAVSQQIAALENDLKTRLLTRRPVDPDRGGRPPARARGADPAPPRRRAGRRHPDDELLPRPTLVVGVTPLAGATPALATALAELRQRMPRLDVTVQTGQPAPASRCGVARGETDLAPDRRPDRARRPAAASSPR